MEKNRYKATILHECHEGNYGFTIVITDKKTGVSDAAEWWLIEDGKLPTECLLDVLHWIGEGYDIEYIDKVVIE